LSAAIPAFGGTASRYGSDVTQCYSVSQGGFVTSRVRIAAVIAASVAGVALTIGGTAAGSSATKIDPRVLRDTAGGNDASFLIHLGDQADLSAAYAIRDQDARG
jgi:hypothetical protein